MASPTRVWRVLSHSPTSNLKQFFKLLLEAVGQEIHQLAARKVHPAEERELRITQQIEGVSASLKHCGLRVFHHHLLELLQEQLQVLREKRWEKTVSWGSWGRELLLRGLETGRKETALTLSFKDKMPERGKAYWFF